MVLAVIYMTATAMSSLSVLACDHDHLHHGIHATTDDNHAAHCHCCHAIKAEAEVAFGCGHYHNLLGDNFTEFVANGERNVRSGDSISYITDYAIDSYEHISIEPATISITAYRIGYESTPPRAAYTSHESLRAPPCWA